MIGRYGLSFISDNDLYSHVKQTVENSVFKELDELVSDNILKSIYLLSFSKYEGFKDFNIKGV